MIKKMEPITEFICPICGDRQIIHNKECKHIICGGCKRTWQIVDGNTVKELPTVSIEGIKYDSEKLRWDLLPIDAIKEIVRVYSFGSKKYGDNNWQSVRPVDRYIAAMFRHFCAWREGEIRDPETGIYHLAHMAWNAIAILWFQIQKDKNDDTRKS